MHKVEQVPDTIEHLDFEVPCQARDRYEPICKGANPATIIVRSLCCSQIRLFCSPCVALKVNPSRTYSWECLGCHAVWGIVPWLDFVTLHPLGGKP